MKNPMKLYVVIVSMLIVSIPFTMAAQEEEKEKKVRIKTVKVIDGEKVVTDTTIVVDSDEEFEKVMAEFDIESDESSGEVTMDIFMDTDIDEESGEKVIVIKSGGGKNVKVISGKGGEHSFTYDFDMDTDIDCDHNKKVIMVSPHSGNHKVMKWKSDDGEEYVIDMDKQHKIIMKELEGELEELEELHIELEGLEDLEHMVFLEKMETFEELEDMDIRVIRPTHPPHHEMLFNMHHSGHGASDRELRDAGIKNKPDRLEADNINIEINDGVVDVSFSLKTEGTPKVVVYNFYGDKVFTGKPELMNGNYEIKLDLSTKQHGVYYMQIIQKNASFTEKLKL